LIFGEICKENITKSQVSGSFKMLNIPILNGIKTTDKNHSVIFKFMDEDR